MYLLCKKDIKLLSCDLKAGQKYIITNESEDGYYFEVPECVGGRGQSISSGYLKQLKDSLELCLDRACSHVKEEEILWCVVCPVCDEFLRNKRNKF